MNIKDRVEHVLKLNFITVHPIVGSRTLSRPASLGEFLNSLRIAAGILFCGRL